MRLRAGNKRYSYVKAYPTWRELNSEVASLDSGSRRKDEFGIAVKLIKLVLRTSLSITHVNQIRLYEPEQADHKKGRPNGRPVCGC